MCRLPSPWLSQPTNKRRSPLAVAALSRRTRRLTALLGSSDPGGRRTPNPVSLQRADRGTMVGAPHTRRARSDRWVVGGGSTGTSHAATLGGDDRARQEREQRRQVPSAVPGLRLGCSQPSLRAPARSNVRARRDSADRSRPGRRRGDRPGSVAHAGRGGCDRYRSVTSDAGTRRGASTSWRSRRPRSMLWS
jgi:hypothetical protein